MDSTKRAKRIRLIVFTALMTALTTALTLASVPLASGYYNFGDVPIFMSACLLGPIPALITGALGAMLGDVILGYMAYAPFTLVIKALEGVIAGLLFKLIAKAVKKQVPQSIFYCLGSIVGGLVMAIGYFLAEGLLLAEDRWTGGVVNLPFNILQGAISAVLATVLLYACQLKHIFEKIYNRAPQVELQSDATSDATQNNEDTQENKTDENNDDLKF
ncbi:MAG: ECF transporter S component [Clostridia bacterium]|nr:ECF transporter S component [Clostridia bacterium]MDE7348768.1 ECF transporter S component [Clostridia bacterium]